MKNLTAKFDDNNLNGSIFQIETSGNLQNVFYQKVPE